MGVIDFHSHILPGIDDGSRNVETSIGMLRMCKEHGVDTMIATPHFYADSNTVERFIDSRQKAYDKVMAENMDIPQIIMGLSLIHISEPTRRTPISYAVFCLKKKKYRTCCYSVLCQLPF